MQRHSYSKIDMMQSQKMNYIRKGCSTDEEDRLEALNQEVDQLMEDVFGVSFSFLSSILL